MGGLKKPKDPATFVTEPLSFVTLLKYYLRHYRRDWFSTTAPYFLPVKLEPLGLSLTGQLRVASQFNSNITLPKKIDITFWLFYLMVC